jgi:hypothetical protein
MGKVAQIPDEKTLRKYDPKPDELERLAGPVPSADPADQAERLRYIAVPEPHPEMLHGRIGVWAQQAAERSEASVIAVFLGLVSYAGIAFGRDASFWLGDTCHHPRLFWLHVGRTARGRKGTSVAPAERLHQALADVDANKERFAETHGNAKPARMAPAIHAGGLSTREGLAWKIRDPVTTTDPKTGDEIVADSGEPDKRLIAIESEFENVLAQSSRDGNTLSSALRDCWDGRSLAPLTKTNRTTATDPHVGVIAHITPSELLELLKDRQITNGFLNRFLVIWAERDHLVALPKPTPKKNIDQWASELSESIIWVRKNKPEMQLNDDAARLYEVTYLNQWASPSNNDLIAALLERAPAIAIRLSMILAITERSAEITADHLRCAIAWTRYWRASVEYIPS